MGLTRLAFAVRAAGTRSFRAVSGHDHSMETAMIRWLRLAALLVAFLLPFSKLVADENVMVKCSVNQDRVWVYDSPASFNVEAKIKCGESVAVVARENGFVKIHTADGTEGYVLEENLRETADVEARAAAQPTPASAARAANAARSGRSSAQPVVSNAAAPAVAGSKTSSASKPEAANTLATEAANANSGVPGSTTAATPSAAPTARNAHPAAVPSASSHPGTKKTTKSNPTAASSAKPATSSPTPVPTHSASPPMVHAAATPPAATQPSQSSSAVAGPDTYVGSASTVPATTKPAVVRKVSDVSSDDEGDDPSYLTLPKYESDDPACQLYFSSYGLSPGQFKWVVDNRKKRFPSVCPAASPAMVDYVIIFTHDVEFFNYTMPAPVHLEAGGMSDWNPIVLWDMSGVPRSEIDRSKHEYVWVFHVKRGTYDPGKFSPHRHFQFTKIESKYSRTVEDAFEFIETHSSSR
jgi:uncharacterized protein YgiM (DUF1202 family)